ncbi:MAG: apolipoprotein N-acyltransferase [Magnetococcales bacterium]|nr:apolipoprotein N-acyltransferase [Magnetococcales bacterium]
MVDISFKAIFGKLVKVAHFLVNKERIPAYLAVIAGMVAVRGLPPIHEEITMMVAFCILFLLLAQTSFRRGAWLGFLFGCGHFTLSFSWLITSIHTYGGFPLPVAILALLLFSMAMAIYPAIFGALLPRLAPRPEMVPIAAPALWVVTEWLRVHIFTGFAWNLTGYGWNTREAILQIADLGGIYILSWLMLFPAAVLSLLWVRRKKTKKVFIGLGMIAMVLGLSHLYGTIRIGNGNQETNNSTRWSAPLRVALVQGNVAQDQKWDPDFRGEGFFRYLDLSHSIAEPVDLVIWPETAVAFFLQASPRAMEQISKLSQHLGAPILTGAPMADKNEFGKWVFSNSAVILDEGKNFKRRYDKHHLVPFGEFIPFRDYIPENVSKLTAGTSDFTPGPSATPLPWNQGNIGLLICYEVIFPEEVRKLAKSGVRWLINITNDAWFGEAAKPQHLAMARVRAIENHLPMVRVANTGISAAFDQFGHELGRIPPNEMGVITVELPRAHSKSLFSKAGDVWIWFWLYLSVAALLPSIWRNIFKSKQQ